MIRAPRMDGLGRSRRGAIPLLAALLSFAAALAAPIDAQDFYLETPRPIAEGRGRYPVALAVKDVPVVIWQDSESTGEESGRTWLSLARLEAGSWRVNRRFAGPYEYRGAEPILFSAAASAEGRIVVAVSGEEPPAPGADLASASAIEVFLSSDGGASFGVKASATPEVTSVAPRIFPSASGGWILFVAQGQGEALTIHVSSSPDGLSWSGFSPLIGGEEGLDLSFLPAASPLPGAAEATDIVVFQSLSGGDRPSFQIHRKLSTDGGRTWGETKLLTDFPDPVNKERSAPDNWDNQRPSLGFVKGRLWLAWERTLRGGQSQVYAAVVDATGSIALNSADRVSGGSGACAYPLVVEIGGEPGVVWFDNRGGANRVYLAVRKGVEWPDLDLSGGSGDSSFGRALAFSAAFGEAEGPRIYSFWQNNASGTDRIVFREPDTRAAAPILSALDFTPGKLSRQEKASIRVEMPPDASGIAGFSYLWSRDPEAEPPKRLMSQQAQVRLAESATEDGPWYLSALLQDFAGNWSPVSRLRFDRKRSPPPSPLIYPPELDEGGFLISNSFSLSWIEPEEEIAGYTWELRWAGPLETPSLAKASLRLGKAAEPLPGLSPYESSLLSKSGPPLPPPVILGEEPRSSWSNVDDGYYFFSVAAIDPVGNISDAVSIMLRANKYVPFTIVNFADATRDDFGRTSLTVLGRGFLAEGSAERVVLDRDGRAPFDIERLLASGGYRIRSDRQIDGFVFEEAEVGGYRIGIFHPKRGWYWTAPLIQVGMGGTVKYGIEATYKPSWAFHEPRSYRFSIYDAFVLAAVLFSALGVFLSFGQVVATARDGMVVRAEVLALVTGGPMPSADRKAQATRFKKRRTRLRVKFTVVIGLLVLFVVLLVAVPLSYFMLQTQSASLAQGLEQRARVLLESVAQGARSYMPTQDTLQLGFLPQQAQAMDDAVYITLTGYGTKSTEPDSVWASNDPDILSKIDSPRLVPGSARLKDQLSDEVARIVAEIDRQAAAEVGDINRTVTDLNQEALSLSGREDEASRRRRDEIAQSAMTYQARLSERLGALSTKAIGSTPPFDPQALALRPARFLFFEPVLYRSAADQLYYRGMVRLEVSTDRIVETVVRARQNLIRITLAVAALAIAVGVAGAFVLSTAIVRPIKRLVRQIENIRDTEDKEDLAGSRIEVTSHDELLDLADAVNQMTEGLVRAAKASKQLIVGKGIQKMFIPLDASGRAKLSTGKRDEKDFEIFGYYEGASGVSGDYWDFKSINSRYHYFIKCDISGKGVSAALIMVQVATMVINYFNDWKKAMPKAIDLTDITYKINDFLEERGFVGRFAAFTLGVWDSQAGIAYLCEAGDRKLHVWSGRQGKLLEELLPDSPAAGPIPSFMVQMQKPYIQVTRKLEPGDVLLLYTDGIEEAKRHFRDREYNVIECADVPKDQSHENHSGGQDGEEFGYDRLTQVLEALDRRGSYRLVKHHAPDPDEVLSFDFSTCSGSLEEQIMALISVEKVFRFYRHPAATDKDLVLVDQKVDDFLRRKRHFDQVRLYLGADDEQGDNPNVLPNADPENPGYVLYRHLREDDQYDDLTILGIKRK